MLMVLATTAVETVAGAMVMVMVEVTMARSTCLAGGLSNRRTSLPFLKSRVFFACGAFFFRILTFRGFVLN